MSIESVMPSNYLILCHPCPSAVNLSQHHIGICVYVCVQKGLNGRDHVGEGRHPPGISTWKLSPSESEHGAPREALVCGSWGAVTSPSRVLTLCWPVPLGEDT